jgi:hypothetical protein
MELEHKAFLKEHYINYETALSGYVRNLDLPILKMYEHIYRTYLNPTFVLTIWCAACRMEMIMRLYAYYVNLPVEKEDDTIITFIIEEPKKRGRKPKINE